MSEMNKPFGGAPVPPMPPMDKPFDAVPEVKESENEDVEENKEAGEDKEIPEQPKMGNPFGGAPVSPMPEMNNQFGGAPVPPMPEMNNQFGGASVPPAAPMGMPFEEGPAPYFIRMRTGERINIDKAEFKIGRKASEVDYAISDNTDISRVHCVIVKDRGVCFISDNNSTNGTYINGQRLNEGEKKFLTNGVVVLLGNEEFVYHIR